jgi:hypothetical protein
MKEIVKDKKGQGMKEINKSEKYSMDMVLIGL